MTADELFNRMKTIRRGSTGRDVKKWQLFLIGRGLFRGAADGEFEAETEAATTAFQKDAGLVDDGVVGNRTWGAAMLLGLDTLADDTSGKEGPNWPPVPGTLKPLVGDGARRRAFGAIEFDHTPTATDREAVTIRNGWHKENIVTVEVPQLLQIGKPRKRPTMSVHRRAVDQMVGLWAEWEKKGLISRIVTFNGAWVARLIRGGNVLSNHAYGSAFDINLAWNRLGHRPALVGREGCVRELVPIANRFGFYWGGHFGKRPDGMHFEIAELPD